MISGGLCNRSFFVWKANLAASMHFRSKTLIPFFLLSVSLHLLLFFSWPKPSKVDAPQAQIPISFLPAPAPPVRDSTPAPKPQPVAPPHDSTAAPKAPLTARSIKKQSPRREVKRTASQEDKQVLPPLEPEKRERREERKLEPIPREVPKSDLSSRPLPSLKDLLPPLAWSSQRDQTGDREGPVSLDTREPRYLTYFETVKRAIEQVWEYPELALRSGLEGKLILEFTILEDGEMIGPRLIHSSGFLELDQEAMRAVRAASPFQPIPASVARNRIDILASFEYSDNRLHYKPRR